MKKSWLKPEKKQQVFEKKAKEQVYGIKERGEVIHQIEKELEQIELERNLHTKQLFTMKTGKRRYQESQGRY